jgi:hypothetical protein
MPYGAPFKLGPFTVDDGGRLSPCQPERIPAFLFRWRDRVVHARLTQAAPEDGRLALQSTLGRVPSSAGMTDETRRPRSFAALHWLPRSVPSDWRVSLLADHRVCLETEMRIALPITAAALITEITRFLLVLAPLVDLLDEEGLDALGAGAVRVGPA